MEWSLSVDSWIVQDGNSPDFERGQHAEFAIEFDCPEPLELSNNATPLVRRTSDTIYEIRGRIRAIVENAWVIDFGIAVYQDRPAPPGLAVGDWVYGIVNLGVDPFFYFESLHSLAGMPPLIYTWRIDRLFQQTAPFIRASDMLIRDPSKQGWLSVERTDAWHDDGGLASYKLDCTLLDAPPKRHRHLTDER